MLAARRANSGNVLSAHGSDGFDMTLQIDGVPIAVMGATTYSGNAWSTFSLNDASVQELSFETRCDFR